MPARQPPSEFINKKFARLLVISDEGVIKGSRFVKAKCDCGTIKVIRLSDMKNGASTNCGCVRRKKMSDSNRKHSMSTHPLHRVWRGINERCTYKNHFAFKWYGGRGIRVCQEWKTDFMTFYNWCMNNGWKRGLQIDRFPDQNGNYSPSNCRIVTSLINNRNKKNKRLITFNGETKCLSEWGEVLKFSPDLLKDRLNKLKWSVEKAFTTPVKNKHTCS